MVHQWAVGGLWSLIGGCPSRSLFSQSVIESPSRCFPSQGGDLEVETVSEFFPGPL